MSKRIILALCVFAMTVISCFFIGGCRKKGEINNTMWFEAPTRKVMRDDKPKDRSSYTVYMAADEKEGCQAVVKYEYVKGNVSVEIEAPENEKGEKIGVEVYGEGYVVTAFMEPFFNDSEILGTYVSFPDGLKPLENGFTIGSNEATPFYILFDSEGAAAGDYVTEFIVKENGNVIDRGKITVHVFNFSLHKTRSMSAVSGLSIYAMQKVEKTEGDDTMTLYLKYYEFLLDHNVTPYSLPYDILDERADKYMDDPRVTQFRVPYSGDDSVIRAYYEKLSQKQEWMDKAYFYPLDEPTNAEGFNQLRLAGERLRSLFPGYRMVVPFFMNPEVEPGVDGIDYAASEMNIWCPKLFCFDSENIYSEEQLREKKPFAERMLEMKERGDDLWWYVCWEPGDPYANLYVNMQGMKNRSIFWQAELYGVNGFLYWSSNYWDQVTTPWEDANTVKWLTPFVYGDGSLLYDGRHAGTDGPCSSLRLEAVRDGIDDYEYIQLAKAAGATDAEIMMIVGRVARSITNYSSNDEDIVRARRMLAAIIERGAARSDAFGE